MATEKVKISEEPVTFFRDRPSPEPVRLAGYSALIESLALRIPSPRLLAGVSLKASRQKEDGFSILPRSAWPGDTLVDHLVFALKYEGLNLLALKRIFETCGSEELREYIVNTPTGIYARRLWFLYEFLTGKTLDLPDSRPLNAVPVADPEVHYTVLKGTLSKRHRVKNNLPGTRDFCPLVYQTRAVRQHLKSGLSLKIKDIVDQTPPEILHRAAAFMMLADSKASFEIEGERPARNRTQRWADVIGNAGKSLLDAKRLEDLQRIVIGDDRFVELGLRTEGGFIGDRAPDNTPQPEHISARPEDLETLLDGLFGFAARSARSSFDPVIDAACQSFGFVYIHPFEDGNGRIHRFLMHDVLARRGFTPPGVVFPISAVIIKRIVDYRSTLRAITAPMIEFIEYRTTDKMNVEVLNDTLDFYRYFDATPNSEFLISCMNEMVERDLPEELHFLERRDRFHYEVNDIVDMPSKTLDLLLSFVRQNNGKLSQRARTREFEKLKDAEVAEIEQIYIRSFL